MMLEALPLLNATGSIFPSYRFASSALRSTLNRKPRKVGSRSSNGTNPTLNSSTVIALRLDITNTHLFPSFAAFTMFWQPPSLLPSKASRNTPLPTSRHSSNVSFTQNGDILGGSTLSGSAAAGSLANLASKWGPLPCKLPNAPLASLGSKSVPQRMDQLS
jgi:hypothetical protein